MTELNKKALIRKFVVGTFISVPLLSSLISTLHLVSLFNLGNMDWMSILLAVAFELGSIAAFLVPAVLPHIKKGMVYSIFAILGLMQVIGNIFYSYDFVFNKLKLDPSWLNSFLAFTSNFGVFEPTQVMLWLAIIIGTPIPLISLFFLKSWIDYLKLDTLDNAISSSNNTTEIVNESVAEIELNDNIYNVSDIIEASSENELSVPIMNNNNLK